MGQTYNYYYKTKELDEQMQKLFMVWLIRTGEDVEITDNFVDKLYDLYITYNGAYSIADFITILNHYLYETGQRVANFCLEDFKDYLFDEN